MLFSSFIPNERKVRMQISEASPFPIFIALLAQKPFQQHRILKSQVPSNSSSFVTQRQSIYTGGKTSPSKVDHYNGADRSEDSTSFPLALT